LEGSEKLQKNDNRLIPVKVKIDAEYENGRTTNISTEEMETLSNSYVLGNKYNEQAI
jgi:hypothetical protein